MEFLLSLLLWFECNFIFGEKQARDNRVICKVGILTRHRNPMFARFTRRSARDNTRSPTKGFNRVGNWFLRQDSAWTEFHAELSLPDRLSSPIKPAHWNPTSFFHLSAPARFAFVFLQTFAVAFFLSARVSYLFRGILRRGLQEECEEASKRSCLCFSANSAIVFFPCLCLVNFSGHLERRITRGVWGSLQEEERRRGV